MKRIDVVGAFDDDLALRVVTEIRAAAGRPIDLRINSQGGKKGALLDILLEVEEHGAPVTTTVVGEACSAAGILAMAGDVRRIDREGTVMLHYGTPPSRERAMEMRRIVRQYTGASPSEIVEWLAREKTFAAREALHFGLVDRIVDVGAAETVRLTEPRKRAPARWLRPWREFFEHHDLRVAA